MPIPILLPPTDPNAPTTEAVAVAASAAVDAAILRTAGQRRINILWEITQAMIAVGVTSAFIFTAVKDLPAMDLKNAFFLIIGFYFGRTNHVRMGGVGVERESR